MAKAKQFVPLCNLEQLEEGEFLADANKIFASLAKELARFRNKHGNAAKKAKSVLNLSVTLVCEDPSSGNERYSIKTAIQQKSPARPAMVSSALEAIDACDGLNLFVRQSGSDNSNPAQMKLATRDGRVIDPDGVAEDRESDE